MLPFFLMGGISVHIILGFVFWYILIKSNFIGKSPVVVPDFHLFPLCLIYYFFFLRFFLFISEKGNLNSGTCANYWEWDSPIYNIKGIVVPHIIYILNIEKISANKSNKMTKVAETLLNIQRISSSPSCVSCYPSAGGRHHHTPEGKSHGQSLRGDQALPNGAQPARWLVDEYSFGWHCATNQRISTPA